MKNKSKSEITLDDVKKIKTLDHLAFFIGMKKRILDNIVGNVSKHYQPFIDQKGKKPRVIDNPSRLMKEIHKRIKDRILASYPIFEGSLGGVPGKTIKDNAQRHLKKKGVVRLDLSDCFHSISSDKIYESFRKGFRFPKEVARFLTDLTTFNGHVPVGSPLSTTLVNIALDDMWRKADKIALSTGHALTDWVDDIVFSGPNPDKLIEPIKKLINSNRLRIGWHKMEIMRSNVAQQVTGVNVNRTLGVPREKRRKYAKTISSLKGKGDHLGKITGQLAHSNFLNQKQGKQLSKLLRNKNPLSK